MNKDYVLYNLDEAQKALGEIIADMRSNRDYDYGEYIVDLTHVYQHLNTGVERPGRRQSCRRQMLRGRFHSMEAVSDERHLSWRVITQHV